MGTRDREFESLQTDQLKSASRDKGYRDNLGPLYDPDYRIGSANKTLNRMHVLADKTILTNFPVFVKAGGGVAFQPQVCPNSKWTGRSENNMGLW